MYDLIVVGGGPAGAAAAISSARHGAAVALFDSSRFPRHKVCGEFVSGESLDLLDTLLADDDKKLLRGSIRLPRARIFVDGRTIETAVGSPAASIARIDLDIALWHSAQKCGVDARQQTMVRAIEGAGPFRVMTSSGAYDARSVINTSGRWSNLNSQHERDAKLKEKWLGVKAHFAEDSPPHSVDLYFFDGGYCGVQPVNVSGAAGVGRINACAMVRADVVSTLSEVFAQHPALLERSRSWQPLSQPVSTSPLIFRQPEPERNGIIKAGDAAAFVDPFVGDGISLAMRSGKLAADSLAAFFCSEVSLGEAVDSYRRAYEQRLSPVFSASSKIRRLLTLPKAVRIPLLMFSEKVPAVARYMVSKTR
ncbi:MAG: NAD(P)/FAD-dependent oxidoreductase [Terriglobales bacterium]